MKAMSSRPTVFIRLKPGKRASHLSCSTSGLTVNLDGPKGPTPTKFSGFTVLEEETRQEEVFERVGKIAVETALEGLNSTVMAYGQTGAGKTYTVMGTTSAGFENRGLCPRCLNYLFERIKDLTGSSIVVRCSVLEIYKDKLIDLLAFTDEEDEEVLNSQVKLMETKAGAIRLRGALCPIVRNEAEALEVLFEGETNRAVAEHQLNALSSRSHCVFSFYIERTLDVVAEDGDSEEVVMRSKLHFVDLAGSERVGKTKSEGLIFDEALYINKSLSFLEQVVIALGQRKRSFIPHRRSKLTTLLKDSLGGNCSTQLVACVWPEEDHLSESISTLRFATRMLQIRNEPVKNIDKQDTAVTQRLQKELHQLRHELVMHDRLRGSFEASSLYGLHHPFSQEHSSLLRSKVRQFIDGGSEIEIVSLRQVQAAFGIFAEFVRDAEAHGSRPRPVEEEGEMVVETVEGGDVMSVGRKHRSMVPKTPPPVSPVSVAPDTPVRASVQPDVDLRAAFEEFKAQSEEQSALLQAKETLADVRGRKRELARLLNDCKKDIDRVLNDIKQFDAAERFQKTFLDVEEGSVETAADREMEEQLRQVKAPLLAELKRHKTRYKKHFAELEMIKAEVKHLGAICRRCKQAVGENFRVWIKEERGVELPTSSVVSPTATAPLSPQQVSSPPPTLFTVVSPVGKDAFLDAKVRAKRGAREAMKRAQLARDGSARRAFDGI